jgi:ABC-type uncharacterized transport system auxiliary subunit
MDRKIYKNVIYSVFAISFVAMALSGCILFPKSYKPVRVFDLKTPGNIAPQGIILDIESFVNESPARRRFFYRMSKYEVENDDYNRWAQTPGLMLNRYLQTAFSKQDYPGENVSRYVISGGITIFEINLHSKSVTLAIEYNIRSYDNLSKTFKSFGVYTEKIDKECPDAFASAMSKAAGQLAEELKREVVAFDKILKAEAEKEKEKKKQK